MIIITAIRMDADNMSHQYCKENQSINVKDISTEEKTDFADLLHHIENELMKS